MTHYVRVVVVVLYIFSKLLLGDVHSVETAGYASTAIADFITLGRVVGHRSRRHYIAEQNSIFYDRLFAGISLDLTSLESSALLPEGEHDPLDTLDTTSTNQPPDPPTELPVACVEGRYRVDNIED